jgi:hypothetical protein
VRQSTRPHVRTSGRSTSGETAGVVRKPALLPFLVSRFAGPQLALQFYYGVRTSPLFYDADRANVTTSPATSCKVGDPCYALTLLIS